jgi:putative ABC transport system permease protein
MNFSESFMQALDSLKANKLRSILTMLGIVMGVFSIITIVAVGNATKAYIDKEFQKLGANIVMVTFKTNDISQNDLFTMEDFNVIKRVAPEVKNIGTAIQRNGTIRLETKTRSANVAGVSSQYKDLFPTEMVVGRQINDIDVSTNANVVVVDELFAKRYFKKVEVVGETIPVKFGSGSTLNMRIIGVQKVETDGIFGSPRDNEDSATSIAVPISTLQSMFSNSKYLNNLFISIAEKDQIKLRKIGNKIVKALETKHGNTDKYMVAFFSDFQSAITTILGVISTVLLVIALITLVVGGIGIINILLVSVTERIREIGIRKALGAQKKDIVLQFITESIMLTGISGLIGIIIGIIAGAIISSIIKIPPVVDLKIIILAFFGSIALGLMFGVYPAKRAADLDPIESLRYE